LDKRDRDLWIPEVAVLMSSYNGEKYINEQIDSILAQVDVKISLYIRDDGSTDNTCSIISRYCNEYRNIQIYSESIMGEKKEEHKNIGPGMSFMRLMYYVVKNERLYDYYAFSDQDDIWKKEKLIRAITKIKDEKEAALYCSNQELYQEKYRGRLRFEEKPDLSLKRHITKNDISGCTMVMNHILAQRITNMKCPGHDILDYRMHDAWIFLGALICGKIIYDHESYILYRIHDNNAVGIKRANIASRIKRGLNFQKGRAQYKNIRMKTAKYFLHEFPEMEKEKKEILIKFADYQKSLDRKLELIKDQEIYKLSGERRIIFAMKVILNYV